MKFKTTTKDLNILSMIPGFQVFKGEKRILPKTNKRLVLKIEV